MAYCMPQVCTLLHGESTSASLSLSGGLNNSPLRFAKNPPVILALIYTLPARMYAIVISSIEGVFGLSIAVLNLKNISQSLGGVCTFLLHVSPISLASAMLNTYVYLEMGIVTTGNAKCAQKQASCFEHVMLYPLECDVFLFS